MKNEIEIERDFYEELESHNYSQGEVRRYAGTVKFFVSEKAVKRAFKRALKEMHKTFDFMYKKKRINSRQ